MSDIETVVTVTEGTVTETVTTVDIVTAAVQGPAGLSPTAQVIGDLVNTLDEKPTPVAADMLSVMDSEAGNIWKRISWTNFKAALATYFDTLYAAALGADDNYVTDAEKVVIGNTSGTNSGDQDLSALATKVNVLELDNTSTYTPTADYHPSTKKYVDDAGELWTQGSGTLYPTTLTDKVGIGTNNPTAKTHIKSSGATSATFSLKIDDSSSNPQLYARDDGVVLVGTNTGVFDASYNATKLYVTRSAFTTYGELARFNTPGATDRPYITVGAATTDGGLLLAMEKDLSMARIGMHGGSSYCFKYNSTGAQLDGLAGLGKTDNIAFNIRPRLAAHKGLQVRGAASQSADLLNIINSSSTPFFTIDASGGFAFKGGTVGLAATVTGSRGGNAALADLLTKLAAKGIIVDGTTA